MCRCSIGSASCLPQSRIHSCHVGLSLGILARIIVSIKLAEYKDVDWIQLTLVNTVTSLHVIRREISEQLSVYQALMRNCDKRDWFITELTFLTTN